MKPLLALAFLAAGAAAQASPFVRREVPVADGAPRVVVDADARAIACLDALRGLAATCGWNFVVESSVLENDLRFATVDRQRPHYSQSPPEGPLATIQE